MIIACDYDGTLQIGDDLNMPLIIKLQKAQKHGDVVILWTCRDGKRLQEAVNKLLTVGFRANYINNNAPETIKMLGYNPRKVLADIYIDDKAVR